MADEVTPSGDVQPDANGDGRITMEELIAMRDVIEKTRKALGERPNSFAQSLPVIGGVVPDWLGNASVGAGSVIPGNINTVGSIGVARDTAAEANRLQTMVSRYLSALSQNGYDSDASFIAAVSEISPDVASSFTPLDSATTTSDSTTTSTDDTTGTLNLNKTEQEWFNKGESASSFQGPVPPGLESAVEAGRLTRVKQTDAEGNDTSYWVINKPEYMRTSAVDEAPNTSATVTSAMQQQYDREMRYDETTGVGGNRVLYPTAASAREELAQMTLEELTEWRKKAWLGQYYKNPRSWTGPVNSDDEAAMLDIIADANAAGGLTWQDIVEPAAAENAPYGKPLNEEEKRKWRLDRKVARQERLNAVEANEVNVRNFMAANGVKVSDTFIRNQATALANAAINGESPEMVRATWERQMREKYVASSFPAWREEILSGQNVADIAAPYTTQLEAMLEMPEGTASLDDPLVRKALQGVDANGKPGYVPLYQFEHEVRQDPRWENTLAGMNETADMLNAAFERVMGTPQ